MGFYRLIDLRASIIQEYVNALRIRGLARSSVVNIIAVLSGALKYAIEPMQYIQYNPCNYIKFPKFAKRQQVRYFITRENFDKILERFPESTPYYLPFLIGYYTGLRIGEVFALTWDEIDMEKRTLTVNKTLIKRNFGVDVRQVLKMKGKKEEKSAWYFGAPKTDKSERTISVMYCIRHYVSPKLNKNKTNGHMVSFILVFIKSLNVMKKVKLYIGFWKLKKVFHALWNVQKWYAQEKQANF